MPEHQLYKWVSTVLEGFNVVGCMLLQPPYEGVVVEFGPSVELYEEGFQFQWRILDNPNGVQNLTSENVEFTKYLQRVVLDRLDEAEGVKDGLENEDSEGSGVD